MLARLADELRAKLAGFPLRARVTSPLYFGLDGVDTVLRVDFAAGRVEEVEAVGPAPLYSVFGPAWQIRRVLDRQLNWEDWCLTLRIRLRREPDEYNPLLHAFLILEAEDLEAFCAKTLERESCVARTVVEAHGGRFEVDRFCPHQGADLETAWVEEGRYLVCPRHRWTFDLENGGACTTNRSTIRAEKREG